MEKIILNDIGEKINISQIEDFEKNIGKKLPDDFKEFMLENNGGCPEEELFTQNFNMINPETSEEITQSIDIAEFMSLNDIEFEYDEIIDTGDIPQGYLPFGYTSFDNLFLICLNQDNYGAIYYVNHDFFDDSTGRFVISKICNSFSDFIESLVVETDDV